jgi:hypothetical protein
MATNAAEPLLLYLGLLTSKMETGGSTMGSIGATYGPGSSPPRAAIAHDVLDPLSHVLEPLLDPNMAASLQDRRPRTPLAQQHHHDAS